ncbi:MAG: hypothetical protein OXC93_12840, partial [Rhodospirillaceae bacterium]|nr:hypothetical protein [Rhodospirillaceae bacterium]
KIKVVGIKVPGRGWWHNTPLSRWNIKGLPTVTIRDATPPPQEQQQNVSSNSASSNSGHHGCGSNAGGC